MHCKRAPAVGDFDAGVTVLVGSLYAYAFSSDVLSLVPFPVDEIVTICNCSGINRLTPVKVSEETEVVGLDEGIHGEQAYAGEA